MNTTLLLIPWCLIGFMVLPYYLYKDEKLCIHPPMRLIFLQSIFIGVWYILCILGWPAVLGFSLLINKTKKD